ncbi:hypothetical protein DENIS_1063 [Desulfonema ishimotonii]|uniref:histidine kinase n=1 Tax=Desulfonema ishimotonii TaxID=45657 RepID=A0A401FT29_9BACT|nr:hybrid sensor histidine kinase/response regulator [Desulfonema ishimotonii]GBC60118.1 hypothetical protein DENIS_1063 [Desulfonema ishimotonii]
MVSNQEKILVVDDDPFVRAMLSEILETEGYHVRTARNGLSALRKYADDPYISLVLSDMNMAEMDGIGLVKALRERDPEIPIIILTVNNRVSIAIEAIHSGASDYILKDENIENSILIRIREVLERSQLRTQNRRLLKNLELKNRELEASNRKLLELNQLKNKFLGIAAHDLRGPIAGIKGIVEMLAEEVPGPPLSETRKEQLMLVSTTTDEIISLIDDLLDVSVIESGQLDICPLKGPIREMLEKHIRLSQVVAAKKHITIHSALADVPAFSFDPCRIGQVFDNLLSNAIKYSPPHSAIHVRLALENARVRVSVTDEGPGIPDTERSMLFREFQKLSAKPTAGEQSVGLGLAISKKIIEIHKGRIEVESRPGEGATFSFEIPTEAI